MQLNIENAPELFRELFFVKGYALRTAPGGGADMTLFAAEVCNDCHVLLTPRPFYKQGSYLLFAYCDKCMKAAEV